MANQALHYHFSWDAAKARSNLAKHGVTFQEAATVFFDRYALNLFDVAHSEDEERWVTIGQSQASRLLIAVHTLAHIDSDNVRVRLISARKVTPHERQQYEERHP